MNIFPPPKHLTELYLRFLVLLRWLSSKVCILTVMMPCQEDKKN